MVYYYTSENIKMIKNILIDYGALNEVSPCEYMKSYIVKCPDTADDSKLSWIVETFLGTQKHIIFLKEITAHILNVLSEEDQHYFRIILYAFIFQIEPKDMQNVYKCIFNLSKPLLSIFTKLLSNNEILTFILQAAQNSYDTNYITEKIIQPLFKWQPYIREMNHNYAEYVKKIESRKYKAPTIPLQPSVLSRKGIEVPTISQQISLPATPPNSLHIKSRRMLTKSAIDQKLKRSHEKNKQRSTNLLNDAKNTNYHFAQLKADKYHKKPSNIKTQGDTEFTSTLPRLRQNIVVKSSPLPVKETTATLKRMHKRIKMVEEQEIEWLHNLVKCCKNTTKVEELEEFDTQERERKRLLNIEKKHLLGQITHEEAQIAKNKLQEDNKKKYDEFLKDKAKWNLEIEKWKKLELDKNRKQIEILSLIELNLLKAKNEITTKKKETADKLKKESEFMVAQAMKQKQKELERRIRMIKEIKILAVISKKAKVPKIIDFTETSGLGLLCEMSIVELQERLSMIKIGLNDELEKKKKLIKDEKNSAKKQLDDTKNSIKNYFIEHAVLRKENKSSKISFENSQLREIRDLKRILEEKRKQRLKFSK